MGLKIKPAAGNEYLEIATDAEAVTAPFLNELIDAIADYLDKSHCRCFKLLVTVTAPRTELTITESYTAWHRASQSSIGHRQIAYVIAGRPMNPLAKFVEAIAENRRLMLRFFEHRDAALEWLTVSTSGTGRVA